MCNCVNTWSADSPSPYHMHPSIYNCRDLVSGVQMVILHYSSIFYKNKKITLCCLVQSVFPFSHLSFSGPVASWWLTCCRPALNLRRPSPPYKQATLWPPSVGLPLDFLEILQFYGQADNGSRRPGAVLSQGVHSIRWVSENASKIWRKLHF